LLYPINPSTVFANILITDGQYSTGCGGACSTDDQVSAALVDMYANDDMTTYVIGFGDGIATSELEDMACWGSGGAGNPCAGGNVPHFEAGTQQQLEMALQTIIESISFDPCCAFNDCSFNPEPTTGEPDPMTTGADAGDTAGSDTMSLTTGPTTGGADTSADTTATSGVDDSSGGASMSASQSGSDSDSTASNTGATMTAGTVTATSGDTDTEGSTTGAMGDDDGCGCTTGDSPRGLLGTLLLLGLGTATRRRRRRS
jgi:MYXO-CTERM domain-containing protein